jgi:IS6 family transposase
MKKGTLFKWKHYQPDIILLTVRWYLRYNLSLYSPELDKRVRRYLKKTNDSWRVDETYVKVKGKWMYLYRAVDSEGNTIDFYLRKNRNAKSAKRFLKKALASCHTVTPRVITVDKNPAYIPFFIKALHEEKSMPIDVKVRQIRYLNNIVEQDHRFIKKRIRTMLSLKSFRTAKWILAGIEAIHMMKKDKPLKRSLSKIK